MDKELEKKKPKYKNKINLDSLDYTPSQSSTQVNKNKTNKKINKFNNNNNNN
jgi:hypothetical protein